MVYPLKPGSCLADAEQRKHLNYVDGCTATGWQFIPFAVSTFGTLGHEAEGLVAMLASYMGSLQLISDDEPGLLLQFKVRISIAAMKGVGKQLLRVLSSIAYVPVGMTGDLSLNVYLLLFTHH